MWKTAFESVIGTSHIRDSKPCQDASRAAIVSCGDSEVLVCVCADGAGSVPHSAHGARLACDHLIQVAEATLPEKQNLRSFSSDDALGWCAFIRHSLSILAEDLQVSMDELACTLLVALVGPDRSVFFQIGDGAIVVKANDDFRQIFRPMHGDFAETTFFLTDRDVANFIQFQTSDAPVDGIAAFTDGIEPLVLSYPDYHVHKPFFHKIFTAMDGATDLKSFSEDLRALLASPHINKRTSDDKSLIIARRVSSESRESPDDHICVQ